MNQPAWMVRAWAEFGQREISGARANPRIKALYADAGHASVTSDEVAWCAAFVGASLERAGIASSRSLLARSYLNWGESIKVPRPGAVAVLSRGSEPWQGHVGFWLGESGERIFLLGGNQSNQVNVAAFAKSRLLDLRWWSEAPEVEPDSQAVVDAFETILPHVLKMEGGYSEDPYDPGGPTYRGITIGTLARYKRVELGSQNFGALRAELKSLPDDIIRSIYRYDYWRPCKAEAMPIALAAMHFDTAVNQGVGTAARVLQAALKVDVDGEIGPITLAAARRLPVLEVVETYAQLRRARYRALSHFWRFGRGWLNRVDQTLAFASKLFSSSQTSQAGDDTMSGELDNAANSIEAPKVPDTKWWGRSVTIWGALITMFSTVLPVVAPFFGLDVTSELGRQLGEQVVHVAQAIGGLVGIVMTIWGRGRASVQLARTEVRLQV